MASGFGIALLAAASFSYSAAGWKMQESGTDAFLADVFFVSSQEGWTVGSWGTVLHTSDGGQSWEEQSTPVANSLSSVSFVAPDTGWVAGSSNLLHTADGGLTWVEQEPGISTDFSGLHFIDSDSGWMAGGKNTYPAGAERAIIHTSDGGETWTTKLYQEQELPFTDVHFIDALNGCVVGELGAIFTTSDGGSSWIERDSGTSMNLEDVFYASPESIYTVGAGGAILFSEDGGTTWSGQSSGTTDYLGGIHFTDPVTGWAVGGSNDSCRIVHTEDGGATWAQQACAVPHLLSAVFFIDYSSGWAVGPYGVIVHTTDGGGVGVEEGRGPLQQPLAITGISPNPFRTLVAVELAAPGGGTVQAGIYDASGRLVRRMTEEVAHSGTVSLSWNGMSGDGTRCPSGVYLLRIRLEESEATALLTLI